MVEKPKRARMLRKASVIGKNGAYRFSTIENIQKAYIPLNGSQLRIKYKCTCRFNKCLEVKLACNKMN